MQTNHKYLKISIIGLPNSGKSTLINNLVEWRVSSTSSKVHTTRKNIVSNFTEEDTQLIFIDTPGLVDKTSCKKHCLNEGMATFPHSAAHDSDIVGVVVDVSNMWTRHALDFLTLDILHANKSKPSFLILNKVDRVKQKSHLLDIIKSVTNNAIRGNPMPGVIKNNQVSCDENLPQISLNYKDKIKPQILKNLEKLNIYRYQTYIKEKLTEKQFGQEVLNKSDRKKSRPHSQENSLVYSNEGDIDIMEQDILTNADPSMESFFDEKRLAKIVRKQEKSWPNFQEVFMVSALNGDGTDDIKKYLLSVAPPAPWQYSGQFITDQKPKEIIIDAIRQELLNELKFQIPYILDIKIDEHFINEDGLSRIVASIMCPKSNLIKILIGSSGDRIKRMSDNITQNLMNTFRCDVYLSLAVKCQ